MTDMDFTNFSHPLALANRMVSLWGIPRSVAMRFAWACWKQPERAAVAPYAVQITAQKRDGSITTRTAVVQTISRNGSTVRFVSATDRAFRSFVTDNVLEIRFSPAHLWACEFDSHISAGATADQAFRFCEAQAVAA